MKKNAPHSRHSAFALLLLVAFLLACAAAPSESPRTISNENRIRPLIASSPTNEIRNDNAARSKSVRATTRRGQTTPPPTASESDSAENDSAGGAAEAVTDPSANSSRRASPPLPQSDSGIPAGVTAQCRDGSYSYSRHHRGTCSHHGGVTRWLD